MFGDSLVFNSKVFVRFCCSEVQKLFAQGRNLRFVFRTLAAIPKSKMRARFSGITYTMHQGGSCNTEVSSGLSRATKWSFKFRKFGRKFGRKVARNEGLLGVAWFRCRARMFKHCFKVCSPNTSRTCFSMFWRFFVLFFFYLDQVFSMWELQWQTSVPVLWDLLEQRAWRLKRRGLGWATNLQPFDVSLWFWLARNFSLSIVFLWWAVSPSGVTASSFCKVLSP